MPALICNAKHGDKKGFDLSSQRTLTPVCNAKHGDKEGLDLHVEKMHKRCEPGWSFYLLDGRRPIPCSTHVPALPPSLTLILCRQLCYRDLDHIGLS